MRRSRIERSRFRVAAARAVAAPKSMSTLLPATVRPTAIRKLGSSDQKIGKKPIITAKATL